MKVGLDGNIDHLKARLVANGYTKIFGHDYCDTFFSMAKIALVHLFLSMVVVHHWSLYQLDIKNGFLHGDLKDKVYIEQSFKFVTRRKSSNMVYRLRRALYVSN